MAERAKKPREADPPEQLAELEAELGRGLRRGYVLRGEERYFRERALDRIRARAGAEGLEVRLHDAENPDYSLARLLDDLSGSGLFAARQVVVARNVEKELAKAGKEKSPLVQAAEAFLAGPDAGTLVIACASLRADHSLVKAVQAAGGSVLSSRKLWDSPPPWGNADPRRVELVLWVLERARALSVKLSPDQAVYLAAATGNDLFALEERLAKLRELPAGTSLREIAPWEATASPWSVAEGMVTGELSRALGGIEALFAGGFEERDGRRLVDPAGIAQILIGSLYSSVRRALAIAEGLARGLGGEEAARAAGVAGAPAVVQREIARAEGVPAAAWRKRLAELLQLERRSKSTVGVEAEDFTLLAVRWRARGKPGARTPAGRP